MSRVEGWSGKTVQRAANAIADKQRESKQSLKLEGMEPNVEPSMKNISGKMSRKHDGSGGRKVVSADASRRLPL